MTAVLNKARQDSTGKQVSEGERRCLVTGILKPRTELIRFVIGPEDKVIPDLSEKLPGQGFWVSADPDSLQQAVKRNVFAKAAHKNAYPSATMAADVESLLRKRCLQLLGLAKGAGITTLGETQTEAALRAGKIDLYFRAPDATRALDNQKAAISCEIFSRDEMGAAFGYDQIAYAGLEPHGLTEKLKLDIKRLQSLILPGKNEG
jgi:predicted RNA-binding protein YlxR (DUF448 family)